MKLVFKNKYSCGLGTFMPGDTTENWDFTEEDMLQLLERHPEWVEQISDSKVPTKTVEEVETPEDTLVIETGEAKLAKSTRKK